MRLVRFDIDGTVGWGDLSGDRIDVWSGPPWLGGKATGSEVPLQRVKLLAPVTPSKVIAIGKNYAEHAREMGGEVPEEPMFFFKPPSAVLGPGAPIVLPAASAEVHHEAELGLVIGKRARRVSEAEATSFVWGVTCVNDVTARDLQRAKKHFSHAKGFDTFCPVGPWVVSGILEGPRRVICRVDGAVRQDGTTADMVYGPARLVAFLSSIMTLEPGDLISTGTPAGVGPILAGQRVEVDVEGIGVLANSVVNEE